MPRGGARGAGARTLRRSVLAHRGWTDLPASLWRPDPSVWKVDGAAHLCSGRPHRPRHPARAVPAVPQAQHRVLRGISGARPADGRGGRLQGFACMESGGGDAASFPRPSHGAGDRRVWPRLFLLHRRPHLHRRRQCHGAARRAAAGGHGIHPVPPDRNLRLRVPDHRRRARRGRLSHQFAGRALHGALRAERQGPGGPGRRLPFDDDRDQ